MEPAQAIGADLAGDLATEDRLIESPIRIDSGSRPRRRSSDAQVSPARGPGQVGREGHQALDGRRRVRGVPRDGDRAIDQDDQRDVVPRRGELAAISKATMPPIDHPPRT